MVRKNVLFNLKVHGLSPGQEVIFSLPLCASCVTDVDINWKAAVEKKVARDKLPIRLDVCTLRDIERQVDNQMVAYNLSWRAPA